MKTERCDPLDDDQLDIPRIVLLAKNLFDQSDVDHGVWLKKRNKSENKKHCYDHSHTETNQVVRFRLRFDPEANASFIFGLTIGVTSCATVVCAILTILQPSSTKMSCSLDDEQRFEIHGWKDSERT